MVNAATQIPSTIGTSFNLNPIVFILLLIRSSQTNPQHQNLFLWVVVTWRLSIGKAPLPPRATIFSLTVLRFHRIRYPVVNLIIHAEMGFRPQ